MDKPITNSKELLDAFRHLTKVVRSCTSPSETQLISHEIDLLYQKVNAFYLRNVIELPEEVTGSD